MYLNQTDKENRMAYDLGNVALTFAALSKMVDAKLAAEYETGRIKGTEYADVFNKLMQQILQLSFESPIKESQKALVDAQTTDQDYVTRSIRPEELRKIQCDIQLCEANTSLVDAKTADQEYVTQNIRPIEMDLKQQELEIAETKNDIALEELEIARQKLILMQKDVDYKDAQIAFTNRQTEGFDDNKKQKMLEIQMNAWAMMFSSGLLDQVPHVINSCAVDGLYSLMAQEVGAPTSGSGCATPVTRECVEQKKKREEAYKRMTNGNSKNKQ